MLSLSELTAHSASPLAKLYEQNGVEVWVKRDDRLLWVTPLGSRAFCGNKWRKLAPNLKRAKRQGYRALLTFGGAYSNHLAAVAAAGYLFGFQTYGIVRGEPTEPLNPTLHQALVHGMQITFWSRADYRRKSDRDWVTEKIPPEWRWAYRLPEGGSDEAALGGMQALAHELGWQTSPAQANDFWAVSAGTGGTAAGLISSAPSEVHTLVLPALKGDRLADLVTQWWENPDVFQGRWTLINRFHFGGYGKCPPDLVLYMIDFHNRFGFPLDPIYTAKLFYGIGKLIEEDFFPAGSRVILIHTGGLQGIQGFNLRYGVSLLEM